MANLFKNGSFSIQFEIEAKILNMIDLKILKVFNGFALYRIMILR